MVITHKQFVASIREVGNGAALGPWALKRRRRYVAVALITLVVAGVVVWIRLTQTEHLKKIMLRHELFRIRHSVMLYDVLTKELPPDIETLLVTQVKDPISGKTFPALEEVGTDKNGRLVDPFGYLYEYDSQTGIVHSTAPCCKGW